MLQEQFYRSALVLGAENIEKLAEKKVALFGLGGVGSFALEGLVRGGIGRFLLVDNDKVDITNCNRQLIATLDTVGELKTEVAKKRALSINPEAEIETKATFVLPHNIEEVLEGDFDYIVDAIDTVSAKIALAVYAKEKKIPLISCMGTGNKIDPTRLEVSTIGKTSICPLCRVLRKELKERGITDLKVVYSTEEGRTPDYSQIPSTEREKMPTRAEGGRRSTPGSVSFVPPVAGMILAGEVIKDLIG